MSFSVECSDLLSGGLGFNPEGGDYTSREERRTAVARSPGFFRVDGTWTRKQTFQSRTEDGPRPVSLAWCFRLGTWACESLVNRRV